MIRSTYRNLMVLFLVLCFGVAFYVFRMAQDYQVEIADRQNDIIRLTQEFENAQSLDIALTELDNLTITEQTATQLDILRHLGLEQSDLNFQLESRDVQNVGSTSLYVHNVRISGRMPYITALQLSDRLQNTKKIVLDVIELNAPSGPESADIGLVITGKIYGLDKVLPAVVEPVAPAAVVTSPEAVSGDVIEPPVDTSVSGTAPVSLTTPEIVTDETTSPTQSPATEVSQ